MGTGAAAMNDIARRAGVGPGTLWHERGDRRAGHHGTPPRPALRGRASTLNRR
ncbi:TetR family transcriptional regulator [Streptomyces sp. GS7]|nr:TetR family transcriptional regulator [Streptomyces sp. GS7]